MEKMTFPADAAVKAAFDDIAEVLEGSDECGVINVCVEPIGHEERSGFIPWTNGGWDGRATVLFRDGKDHFASMSPYEEEDHRLMLDEFHEEMARIGKADAFDDATDEDVWKRFPEEAERWREQWRDADDDVFFLDFRAVYYAPGNHRNKSGEPEVYFFAGVNTDFNYGRDSIAWLPYVNPNGKADQHVHKFEADVTVAELTPERLEEIKQKIIETFQNA